MVAGMVQIVKSNEEHGGVHFAGLMSCGLVWECAVCAARIAAGRAKELSEAIDRHIQQGGGALFVTLTMPHDYGDALKPMRKTVANAWRFVIQGKAWQHLKEVYGLGFVRGFDITHGKNGWHPHIHAVLFTNQQLTETDTDRIRQHVVERWKTAVVRAGYREPDAELCPVETVYSKDIGNYVSKFGAACEVVRWDNKEAREGGRTPFQILADVKADGDALDVALWNEWCEGITGAKQLTWSRGLRERLCSSDLTDEQLAIEEDSGVVIATLSGDVWREVRRVTGMAVKLLDAAEYGGQQEVFRLLNQLQYWPHGPPSVSVRCVHV